MSILGTVREFFEGTDTSTTTDGSDGAYWCHDCGERIRDVDYAGEGAPECPSCGDAMEFERSIGASGCAC